MVIDGPMNGDYFLAYVEQAPVPELRPGDVVIMDNLPAHRVHGMRQAIEAAGASLRCPPPHSPDFSSIEIDFVKLFGTPRGLRRQRFGLSGLDAERRLHADHIGSNRTGGTTRRRPLAGAGQEDPGAKPAASAD